MEDRLPFDVCKLHPWCGLYSVLCGLCQTQQFSCENLFKDEKKKRQKTLSSRETVAVAIFSANQTQYGKSNRQQGCGQKHQRGFAHVGRARLGSGICVLV